MAVVRKLQTKTQTTTKDLIYSDLTHDFTIHPDKNDLTIVSNEESVKRSLINILNIGKYEKLFNPDFGANLKALLFEPISYQTENAIRNYIKLAVANYEPRARLLEVIVSGIEDESAYNITITFDTINTVEPSTLEITLYRVR